MRAVRWAAGLDPRVLPGLLAEVRGTGAVMHAHDAHAVTLAGLAARLARRPFVATRRVEFPLRRPGAWGRAARVIAISSAVAEALEAGGVARDRIAIIHSGIPVAEVRATSRLGVREQLGLSARCHHRRERRRADPGKGPRHPASRRRAARGALALAALGRGRRGRGTARPRAAARHARARRLCPLPRPDRRARPPRRRCKHFRRRAPVTRGWARRCSRRWPWASRLRLPRQGGLGSCCRMAPAY